MDDNSREAKIIAWARGFYCNDDVEIDDEPAMSEADNGTWVAAWVWVNHEDAGIVAD
jgi:hypothetical protein